MFTLNDFHIKVKDGIKEQGGVFRSLMHGDSLDLKNMETQSKILNAMYDEEKINWKGTDYQKKKEIVETA